MRLVYYTFSVASPALIYRPFASLSSIHLDSLFIVSPQNYCHAQWLPCVWYRIPVKQHLLTPWPASRSQRTLTAFFLALNYQKHLELRHYFKSSPSAITNSDISVSFSPRHQRCWCSFLCCLHFFTSTRNCSQVAHRLSPIPWKPSVFHSTPI